MVLQSMRFCIKTVHPQVKTLKHTNRKVISTEDSLISTEDSYYDLIEILNRSLGESTVNMTIYGNK